MKTFPHLWQYLAELFLELDTFQIKAHFVFSYLFPENRAVNEVMSEIMAERYGLQTTRRMRFECYINKATPVKAYASVSTLTHAHAFTHAHTHKYVILLSHGNSGYVNAPASLTLYLHCRFTLFSKACYNKCFLYPDW
jgi:hypothetical protein